MSFDPSWLGRTEKGKIHTHLVVVCDTFDHEDYPVYVSHTENVRTVVAQHNGPNMQKVMEVYDLTESEKPLSLQKAEHRSFNYGDPEKIRKWVEARQLQLLSTDDLKAELARRGEGEARQSLPLLTGKNKPKAPKRESYKSSNEANRRALEERRKKLAK